jgi:hypothetical protein
MHTGEGAVLVGFTQERPGPQSVPAKLGRSVHASPSTFDPTGTHAAMRRPAPSSANESQPWPPVHVEASKGSHTGEHP